MSEQTHQPEQASQTNAVQSSSDAPQTDRDDATPTPSPNGEETTAADTATSVSPPHPPSSDEIGEPTAPMQVQPATTIQVPALPADASTSAAPPPDANTETNEQTQVAAPSAPTGGPASAAGSPPPSPSPAPAQPAVQATSNPFVSIEDLVALQIASEPQVSPDGLQIAYVVLKSDAEANTTRSSIWLVPALTGASGKLQPPRQLTAEALNSVMPRWSPDGRWLAFLSDRSGSMQIYLLPLNGGEARQVSSLKQSVTEFCWRPDSHALLAVSPWKTEDDQPTEQDEEIVQVWTRLDETWDGIGYKHGRHQQLWLIDLGSDQPATRLTFEPIDHLQPCWSPDGKEIAFCANRRTAPDLSVSAALWVLNLETGRSRRLSPSEGLAQQPAWSPDGRWLAFYYATDQSETANVVPWIVEASGQSAPRPATTASLSQTSIETLVDNLHLYSVSRPCWYPDNTSLMVTVQARGQVHINRLYINTNHEEPLTTGNGCYLSPHMSTNGRTIAALRTDWFTPGDIWAMAGNGANRRRLTGLNDVLLRSRQLIRPKKISWRSFDGLEIEGWLYLPPLPPGERAPLVLDVHGGPTLAWAESYVHDFQVLAGMGYAVLAVNPRGSAGYGEEFCRKIINDWGGDDFRDLMLGVDHVIATEPIDGSRLAITGASYGGYMTCWAITQTRRFKAAVARNPVTSLLTCGLLSDQWLWFGLIMGTQDADQDPETLRRSCSPMTFADAITTPLLLIHSTEDLRCPPSESLQLFNVLRARQHTVELALYPGASHLLDFPGCGSPKQRMDRERRSFEWIKKYV
jgi:dipeptidyl aminopeptidase/acylaminoacyl peptidase